MSLDLTDQTALELEQLYSEGRVSPGETVEAGLGRVQAFDEVLNAFCVLDPADVHAQAARSQERWRRDIPRGRLEGVPVAVKDVFEMRGWPNRKGSRATSEAPAEADAPAVAAVKRHGAILMGRTTTPEFGWKAVTDSPLYGITRNPWDPSRTPGGSSGGSAVAVACGMAPLALGTDAGGSARIPASFCGVVGHKPTVDLAPMWPPSSFAPLGHVAALGWTVGDIMRMIALLAEADWQNSTMPRPANDILSAFETDVTPLRVAYSPRLGLEVEVEPQVAARVAEAASVFEELGALVEEADPPIGDQLDAYRTLYASGGANGARHFDQQARAKMEPGFVEMIEAAEGCSMLDYLAAMNRRMSLIDAMEGFHRHWDLLITPTVPITPFEAGRLVPDGWPNEEWMTWSPFTWPFNMTGQPAISVPCGTTDAGLPVGLQVVGPRWADRIVLGAAHAFQSARPFTWDRPATPTSR